MPRNGWMGRQKDSYDDAKYIYELGCEVLGKPRGNMGFGTVRERADRLRAGRAEYARRQAAQKHYPAPSRDGGYYSRYISGNKTTEIFIGPDGNLTSERPHVHVIHDDSRGEIRIVVTWENNDHTHFVRLPGTTDGNAVNAAIDERLRVLRSR